MSTPLFDCLSLGGAAFDDSLYGERVPAFFGEIKDEYDLLSSGQAWFDYSMCGRIKMSGKDAIDLLHRLSTNDLKDPAVTDPVVTMLTNEKGRLLDVVTVVRRENHVLLLTSAHNDEAVMKWLDRFIIMEDVKLENITDSTCQIHVFGGSALGIAQDLAIEISSEKASVLEQPVVHSVLFGSGNASLICDRMAAQKVIDFLQNHAVRPVGALAIEVQRIESKRPILGREITEKYNPIELGLIHFISFTKGCYVGQEVIARLDSYNKVQRCLALLRLDEEPVDPYQLYFEDPRVGEVTSAAYSFSNNCWMAIAVVKKEFTSKTPLILTSSRGQSINARLT